MKRFWILFILAFIVFSAIPDAAQAMKMNIDPARAEVKVKAGEEKTGVVSVLNYDETGTIHVKAYVQDLVYLPDGSNDFLPLGSTPWSMGDWIKIGPTEFDIPAGKQEAVRYVITVPKDAKGGRYGVIFFETVTPPSDFKQVGASVNVRLGTIMLVTVEGTSTVKAKLTGMTVTPPRGDKPLNISWTVRNNSNILIRPFGTLKIIDDKKTEVVKLDVNKEKAGILPETNRRFSVERKEKLPRGTYFTQLVLDYGGETLLGAQSKFRVD